jgi:hypothetical protein
MMMIPAGTMIMGPPGSMYPDLNNLIYMQPDAMPYPNNEGFEEAQEITPPQYFVEPKVPKLKANE